MAKKEHNLINFSQIILSLQLSFAVIPLLQFTGDKLKMGRFANSTLLQSTAWDSSTHYYILNIYIVFHLF